MREEGLAGHGCHGPELAREEADPRRRQLREGEIWSMGAPARERRKDARQGRPPLGPAGEGPCRRPRLPEPRRHLAGVHWIFATIPAIWDDLHQAFTVAKGAATNTAAGSADRRWVSVGA